MQNEIKELNKNISYLDNEYNKKLSVLDQKGVLKNLKTSLKIYESKKDEAAHIKYLFNEYTKCDKQKKELQSNRLKEIILLDSSIEEQDAIKVELENKILEVHDFIMGNRASSLNISTNNRKNILWILI